METKHFGKIFSWKTIDENSKMVKAGTKVLRYLLWPVFSGLDPHLIYIPDTDPNTLCGSGSGGTFFPKEIYELDCVFP